MLVHKPAEIDEDSLAEHVTEMFKLSLSSLLDYIEAESQLADIADISFDENDDYVIIIITPKEDGLDTRFTSKNRKIFIKKDCENVIDFKEIYHYMNDKQFLLFTIETDNVKFDKEPTRQNGIISDDTAWIFVGHELAQQFMVAIALTEDAEEKLNLCLFEKHEDGSYIISKDTRNYEGFMSVANTDEVTPHSFQNLELDCETCITYLGGTKFN